MREGQTRHPIMVSPAAGFTNRVMARIAERERQRVRRRAMVGGALLFGAAVASLTLIAIGLVPLVDLVLYDASTTLAVLGAIRLLLEVCSTMVYALGVAGLALVSSLGAVPMLGFALGVLAMNLIWLRVVSHSFQHPLPQLLGGSK